MRPPSLKRRRGRRAVIDRRTAETQIKVSLALDGKGHLFYSIGDRGHEDDAQDLAKPAGKIHRINVDGSTPTDNPFSGRPGVLATIWSYGHRNPQGLVFHPVTGAMWETEHGPSGGDELNRIEPGRNYGWPIVTSGQMFPPRAAPATPIAERP